MENTSPHYRSKQPKSPLAGPYGHPMHPTLVTIPIGAWTASLIFDVVAFPGGGDEASFAIGAQWLTGIGIVGAVAAAVFGLMDMATLTRATAAHRTAVIHMSLNLAAVALFAVSFFIRLSQEGTFGVLAFGISVVAYAMIGASGYLGGKLAYHYGVRVADEKTQSQGFLT